MLKTRSGATSGASRDDGKGNVATDTPFLRSIRFRALDSKHGDPLPQRPYVLTRQNGSQHRGVTDAMGFAEAVDATAPEQVGVHFMFTDANGHTIEREDLLP